MQGDYKWGITVWVHCKSFREVLRHANRDWRVRVCLPLLCRTWVQVSFFHGSSGPVSFLSISHHDAVETHEGSIAYIIISMRFSLSSVKECHSFINVNNSIKKTTSHKIHSKIIKILGHTISHLFYLHVLACSIIINTVLKLLEMLCCKYSMNGLWQK